MKKQIGAICCFLLFVIIGILAINGLTENIDLKVYKFIIQFKNDFLTSFFKLISFIFSTPMIIFYCIISFFIFKNRKYAIFLCYIIAFQSILNNLIKLIYKRPRPSVLNMVIEKTYSYPSGHTMTAIILLTVIGFILKQKYESKKAIITIGQIILIILVGISRIYLGVHYFTDIIGAIFLSLFIILLHNNSKLFIKKELK